MDDFAKLAAEERKPYFETAAARAGNLGEHIIEKDFWVCWTLKRLFTLPLLDDHLIFKGGTSLSKVFNVIERFSEDIDLSLSKELLGFGGDKDPEKASGSKQRNKRIEELAEACADFVKTKLHGELHEVIKKSLGTGKGWKLEVDPDDGDGQTLLFEYPPTAASRAGYVRPLVKIEIGARSDHWPAHEHKVRSYLAEQVTDAMKEPETLVKTLDAARTFWEKATILHSYVHYPESKTPAARQSRHYYDLYRLLQTKHKKEAAKDLELLARVAEHKGIYFRADWAKYEEAKKGSLKLFPGDRVEDFMRRDYEQMQEMIFGEPPAWADILAAIKEFEAEFNA
jgi:hypothetical protein